MDLLIYFIMGTAMDFCYSMWTRHTADRNILRAGVWAFLIGLVQIAVTLGLISNPNISSGLAYAVGLAVGSMIAMRMQT